MFPELWQEECRLFKATGKKRKRGKKRKASLPLLFVWAKQKDPKVCTKLGAKIIESIIENMPMQ